MTYSIRRFQPSDAGVLTDIALAAIRNIGANAYNATQIDAWAGRHGGPATYHQRIAQGHVIFVAVDEGDRPVAYALLEPDGHLDRLYNHPDHTRQGLAQLLLCATEAYGRANSIPRLYTEASELARPSFEHAGYSVVERPDFSIEHEGKPVPIHNYAMEKLLV